MSKEKIKDIAIRALKTFVQAFVSALTVDSLIGITDVETLKKVLISIIIAAVAAGISAVWNMAQDMINAHLAGKGAGIMTFDEFVKKYLGRAVDYDGAAGPQCVDLIKMMFKYVLGIAPKAIGNAHAYFDNFVLHSFLNKNFVRIKNSPKFVPMKDDVCVWSKKMNKFGHVALSTGEGDTNRFTSYDMNWNGKEMKIVEHNYNYFLGVLRPINRENIDGKKIYKTKKALNIRKGPGTKYDRVLFSEFSAYEKEQVLANGGKVSDNCFPKGMLIMIEEERGSWGKISNGKWLSLNFCSKL